MYFGNLIKVNTAEYAEEDLCVREYKVEVLGIPVYKARHTSTNNQYLNTLKTNKRITIKGFNNEN